MSIDWGNGIRTGQEVFSSQELDLLKSVEKKVLNSKMLMKNLLNSEMTLIILWKRYEL